MTAAERALWQRVQRRAAQLNPALSALILAGFARLRDRMGETALTRAIELGFTERIFETILSDAVLAYAFLPVRERLRVGVGAAFRVTAPDIPKRSGSIGVAFDTLNPRILDAIRTLESRVITTLETTVRETVRESVTRGLSDGLAPRTIARGLRDVIGLAPNQLQDVANYRAKLEAGHSVTGYTLRDKRYDGVVKRNEMTPAQIDTAVDTYRKRRIALNAETNARTAALDAQKLGQQLSWQDAIGKGIVDGDRLYKSWVGVLDDRERPEHIAMEGVTVPFDQPYPLPSGEMIPGESTFNCRCISRVFVQ